MTSIPDFVIPTKPSTGGRPAQELTPEVESYLIEKGKTGCSIRAVALALDVSENTITDNKDFYRAYKKGRAEYLIALHEKQYDLAFNAKNEVVQCTQAIWLGKQDLGQSDKAQPLETQPIINVTLHVVDTRKPKVIDVTPEPEPEELPLIEDKGT